jgi:hypothetical protein
MRKTPFTSYYRPTSSMFSVRKASLPFYNCSTLPMFSVRKASLPSYNCSTLPMFSVRKASLPSYHCSTLPMFSVRKAPITPITPMFSSYRSVSELDIPPDDVVSTRTEAALEEIKNLGEPTLVQQYAKLPTDTGLLLGE